PVTRTVRPPMGATVSIAPSSYRVTPGMRRFLASLLMAAAAAGAATLRAADSPPVATPVGKDPGVVSAVQLARGWLEAQRAYARIPGVSAAVVYRDETLWKIGRAHV